MSRGNGASRVSLIELVGPAGAGKSTLAAQLPAHDPRFGQVVSVWHQPRWSLALSALALIPTIIAAFFGRTPLRGQEMAQMVRIDSLRRLVRRARARGHAIILDEGPVFGLGYLHFWYRRNGDPGYAAWRRRAVRSWAELLDAIVHLDASDAVLARRIKERRQAHLYKRASDAEIAAFTTGFREAYDRVVADLARHGVRVVRLTTEAGDAGSQATEIYRALEDAAQ